MQNNNPFERFINTELDSDALKHIVKTFAAEDTISGPEAENGEPYINLRVRRVMIDTGKLRASLAKLDPDTVERAKRAIDEAMQRLSRETLAQVTAEDLRRAQVECYIARYGMERVAEAERFATENGIEVFDALQLLEIRDAVNRSAEAMRAMLERVAAFMQSPSVQATINEIGARMSQAIADGIEQRPEPSNRHERRAQKHNKPMKDGDQRWNKRRDFRDRR